MTDIQEKKASNNHCGVNINRPVVEFYAYRGEEVLVTTSYNVFSIRLINIFNLAKLQGRKLRLYK